MKSPYDKLANIIKNYFGHMTKMASYPYIVNKTFWDLVCSIGDSEPTKFVQMMILG